MTTAARPTFDTAKGGSGIRETTLGKLTQQVSSRDLPSHLKLKERKPGQDTVDEINEKDFKAELEERERIAQLEKARSSSQYKFVPSLEQAAQVRFAIKAERDREREAEKESLLNGERSVDLDSIQGPDLINARKMAQLDADDDFGSCDFSESDFDDGDDEDDDPAELMAELERIKQERASEEEKRAQELKLKEEQTRSDIESVSSFSVKRRWDDDVPFKNCAREEPDPKRNLYINDTLRQEFHKKFMDKYIR